MIMWSTYRVFWLLMNIVGQLDTFGTACCKCKKERFWHGFRPVFEFFSILNDYHRYYHIDFDKKRKNVALVGIYYKDWP